MEESANGVACIKGEIHSIMTLMRLNTQWSAAARMGRDAYSSEEDSLVQPFRSLNEYLEGIFALKYVDCVMYIMPFHNVIVSEKASGPLTSAALTSLTKFALYGFLSESCPRVQEGVSLIANCISRCVFEETDWESDEMILMKLLELSTLCFRCEASKLLTIAAAWEMYHTCISIHNHYKASKILKSDAENALVHLTLSAFGRVVNCAGTGQPGASDHSIAEELESIRGHTWEAIRDNYNMSSEVGVTLLLTKVLATLSDMADMQKNSAETVRFALVLINVALEAGGSSLGSVRPLVDILSNDVCRHLLRASQSEDLGVVSLALRVVFNLFMSIKNHMKVQLEVFLISVHLRLISTTGNGASTPIPGSSSAQSAIAALTAAKEELALESLLEFCREPSLMNDIYVNYDCDMQCTNLFDTIITTLCCRALPKELQAEASFAGAKHKGGTAQSPNKAAVSQRTTEAASPTQLFTYGSSGGLFGLDAPLPPPTKVGTPEGAVRLSIVNRLALDGVLAVLRSLAGQASSGSAVGVSGEKAVDQAVAPLYNGSHRGSGMAGGNRGSVAEAGTGAPPSVELDQQVDKWCESGSTSPTEVLSQDDADGAAGMLALAPTALHRHITGGSLNSDAFSASAVASPHSSRGGRGGGVAGAGLNAVDGENEVTAAVLAERTRRAELLRERKMMKQKLKLAAEKFNKKPMKPDWIRFAMDLGILEPSKPAADSVDGSAPRLLEPSTGIDAAALAKFFRRTPGLGKTQIGEYISKGPAELHPFHAQVLREYVRTFDFSGENSSFDGALRMFLGEFRLPGESQCIDRLMEAFAGRLFEYLGPGKPFASADAAFILAFSTIMLNTDLHNPQIPQSKKMTKAEFLRNNRGINDGADLPPEYLENLYYEIKNRQIQVDLDMSDSAAPVMVDLTDSTMWNKIVHKGTADQAPAVFTTAPSRRPGNGHGHADSESGGSARERGLSMDVMGSAPSTHRGADGAGELRAESAPYERDLFLVMSKPVLETLVLLWSAATEDQLVYRLLQGLWDFISICTGFGMDQMLSSTVQLLCARSKQLMHAERLVPLRPYTRRNVLAHKQNYKQLQVETGVDLAALLQEDLTSLMGPRDRKGPLTVGAAVSGQAVITTQVGADKKPSALWAYSSLIKGEILMKLAFQTAQRVPFCLRDEAWAALVRLLTFARSRGALPPSLALVGEDFSPRRQEHAPGASNGEISKPLPPSPYAHRCYLEAYGLTLSYPGQNGQGPGKGGVVSEGALSHNQGAAPGSGANGSSWLGFLFSAGDDEQAKDANVMHSGMLDLPNLYCNLNASAHVDMTSAPLRPDDELLKVAMEQSAPAVLLFASEVEEHFAGTSLVLHTLLRMLTSALEVLATPARQSATQRAPKSGEASLFKTALTNGAKSLSASVDKDDSVGVEVLSLSMPLDSSGGGDLGDAFPLDLLEGGFALSEAKELDAVAILEWAVTIVLKDQQHIQYFWPDLYGFLRLVLEENVDVMAAKCPYFLERCIGAVVRAAIVVVDLQRAEGGAVLKQGFLSSAVLQSAALQAAARHASFDMVWRALRMMRGVPSEVISNLSDRLGAGVLEIIRRSHATGMEMTADRWFLLFSLLSAATAGAPGRGFVWTALCFLVDNDLIDETNFTACRHLVLRFAHGVFPGDISDEHRNKTSGAASAHKKKVAVQAGPPSTHEDHRAHVVEAISYLMRLCFMALGGYEATGAGSADHVEGAHSGSGALRQVSLGRAGAGAHDGVKTATFVLPSVLRGKDAEGRDAPSTVKGIPGGGGNLSTHGGARKAAGGDREDGALEVRCVVLPRAEEVEGVWSETCKALADLVASHFPNASFRASYSLEAIVSAGTKVGFSNALIVKVLGDLVQRLPLGMQGAGSVRPAGPSGAAPSMSVDLVAACQRSCNIVFDLVVQKMKVMRDSDSFQAIFVRVVSILAANALTGAARGHQWWHDEMCDTLEALLRLVRLPEVVSTVKTSPRHGAEVKVPPAASSRPLPAASASSGGLFGWLVAPLIQATEVLEEPATVISPTAATASAAELEAALKVEPSDGYLLKLSWEQACKAYPSYPATLRMRDPKLHGKITAALHLPAVYFRKNTPSKGDAPLNSPSAGAVETSGVVNQKQEHVSVGNEAQDGVAPTTEDAPNSHGPVPTPAEANSHSEREMAPPLEREATLSPSPTMQRFELQQSAVSTPLMHSERARLSEPEGDSLFSISLTDTPQRTPAPYETPLADITVATINPATLQDTPSYISSQDSSFRASEAPATASPYVKNLTPIFASAEGPTRGRPAGMDGEAPAAQTDIVSPVRAMAPLLSPEPAVAASATSQPLPTTPGGPWQTYPTSPPTVGSTVQTPQSAGRAAVDGAIPRQGLPSTASAIPANGARIAFKPHSKVQVV